MVTKHCKLTGYRSDESTKDLGTYIIDLVELSDLLLDMKAENPDIVRILVDIAL